MQKTPKLNLLFLLLLYHGHAIIQAAEPQQSQIVNIPSQILGRMSLDIRGLNLIQTEQALANEIDERASPIFAGNSLFLYKRLKKRQHFTTLLSALATAEIADRLFSKTSSPDSKFKSIHEGVKLAKHCCYLGCALMTLIEWNPIDERDPHLQLLLHDPTRFSDQLTRLNNSSLSEDICRGIGILF